MNTATWLQSTPAVALIDYYLHSTQHGLPTQRSEENEAAIQRWIDDMPDGKPHGKPITATGIAIALRDLDAAKVRIKGVLGGDGNVSVMDLLNLAADEIERLRQQLAHLDMLAAVIVIVVLFAAAPAAEGPPIIGPAPCNSDTPWACFDHHIFVPLVGKEN